MVAPKYLWNKIYINVIVLERTSNYIVVVSSVPRWILTVKKNKDNFTPLIHKNTLREKCPNTEFFLVRIFRHSYWIRIDASYLSVFSPNAGKYKPEKTKYLDTFHAVTVLLLRFSCFFYKHHFIYYFFLQIEYFLQVLNIKNSLLNVSSESIIVTLF